MKALLFVAGLSTALAARAYEGGEATIFERARLVLMGEFSGGAFYYYDQADRVQILQDLVKSIQADYSLLEIKRQKLGIDFEALAAKALAAESAIEDLSDTYEQAKSNLAFLDRMDAFVAQFQDTHFHMNAAVRPLPILLGVTFTRVGEKYYVANLRPKLMAYTAEQAQEPAFKEIEAGDEVVDFDGKPVAEAVKDMMPYVSASSPEARAAFALTYLTTRNFRFSEHNSVVVTMKKAGGEVRKLRMPWYARMSNRGDQRLFFARNEYKIVDDLRLQYDEKTNSWETKGLDVKGYVSGEALRLLDSKSYMVSGDPDTIAVRTGYVLRGGKAYGVMQINSFYAERLVDKYLPEAKPVPYLKVPGAFIKELKASKTPLILDIRNNGGGFGSYPGKILSMITETGKKYPRVPFGFRMTRFMRQLRETTLNEVKVNGELIEGASQEDLRFGIDGAVSRHATHTASFVWGGDIEADPQIAGYSEKVVALISPRCISACDIMAMTLEASGRATLIGTQTNGTGAGFASSEELGATFQDTYSVLKTEIPNSLFGLPGPVGQYILENTVERNSENRPVKAQLAYDTQIEDILGNDGGWMNKALDVIDAR